MERKSLQSSDEEECVREDNLITEGTQAYFALADVEPAYEGVLPGLLYPRSEYGYEKAFPSDTPNLDWFI
jgi:hypothetical protein